MATWEIEYRIYTDYDVTIQADTPEQARRIFEEMYNKDFAQLEDVSIVGEIGHEVMYVGHGVDNDVQAWEERNIA